MISTLKKSLDNYFEKLALIGYIENRDTDVLSVASFLQEFICSNQVVFTQEIVDKVNLILDCISSKKPIIGNFPQLMLGSSTNESGQSVSTVIAQSGESIVTTTGTPINSETGDTLKFSDFAYQSSLGTEDFIAGYDSTLNTNIRVNAGSLVLTWQPI